MNNAEKRFYTHPLKIEERADGQESRTISGYGVVFDKWSRNLGWFREKINRNAFDDVDFSEVVATFNHNFDNILARVDSDTLKLSVDDTGVKYTFEAPNTTVGNDLLENVRNGNVKGSSFMFTVEEETWTFKDNDEVDDREVMRIGNFYELGPVTVPAYPDTTAAKRSYEAQKPKAKHDKESVDLNIRIRT